MSTVKELMERDGFVIIRDLFTPEEMNQMNQSIDDFFKNKGVTYRYGLTQPNIAVEEPEFSWVFEHPKVLEAYRAAFGEGEFVFISHEDIHHNMGFGWHKDDGKGYYFTEPYFTPECRVYKIGVYMNDHSTDGNGMSVRVGSHLKDNLTDGQAVSLATKPGNVVIFDVRITHAGKEYDVVERGLLKIGRLFGDHTGKSNIGRKVRDLYCSFKAGKPKRSLFFTLGPSNIYTYDFSKINMKRQIEQSGKSVYILSDKLSHSLNSQGVKTLTF
ncbi:phytanoyl-CoA dioxygenase family protein [Pseudomonas lundensis]|uniref:phytanoyl-CoA dioxygenase family protein n=1 Tax=Serratia proteamaculans TaxID=28151 RepID=UPI002981EED4|nr:phytanoyl-CoA dioxygenase family protein [Serratia proteamaculans]MDW5499823.1 phytanoyl-CoA dioxygenase family protein [Serratia proteamaculans]MDW5504888.1 phytanoyl-CoA dioxygenase family protein [Pseudomonas lundensis]